METEFSKNASKSLKFGHFFTLIMFEFPILLQNFETYQNKQRLCTFSIT